MIVVDANVFLRHLAPLTTVQDVAFSDRANALFTQAKSEDDVFSCTDAVIAEVVFILSAKRHYAIPRFRVYGLLAPVLRLRGCALTERDQVLSALKLWVIYRQISFVDCLCMTQAIRRSLPLMTFDARLARIHTVESAKYQH